MRHYPGGTDDQISVERCRCPVEPNPCEVCTMGEVEDPGESVLHLVDPGRNWRGVLGQDILHVCRTCALQHEGKLLERIKRELPDG